jgi:hypothetical protein
MEYKILIIEKNAPYTSAKNGKTYYSVLGRIDDDTITGSKLVRIGVAADSYALIQVDKVYNFTAHLSLYEQRASIRFELVQG